MKAYLPVAPGARVTHAHTRPVYVPESLDRLHGPTSGTVQLPLKLDWTPSSSYDLSAPARVRSLYATVMREASGEADIEEWLDARLLRTHWSELNLSRFIRQTWETKHPELSQCR